MSAPSEAMERAEIQAGTFDFEEFFHLHYQRIARLIARLVGDRGRSEDLAAEALWKLWQTPQAQGERAAGWLYRTAVRLAWNELRSGKRRQHYEALSDSPAGTPTPEQAHAANQERAQVREVLAGLRPRDTELLILRSSGLSYEELANTLELNAASVGTLLARAQRAFRKEYVKRYGTPR